MLITGAAGALGTAFWSELQDKYDLVGLDIFSYASFKDYRAEEGRYGVGRIYCGDVRNYKDIAEILEYDGPFDAILHLACETHNDRSISGPNIFYETNVIGTQKVLEAAKNFKIPHTYVASCYDEKSRALTLDGLKTFEEIKKGDKVFSLNPETKEIEEKEVLEVIVQDYCGPMVQLKTKRTDLLVTPNHRIFFKEGHLGKIQTAEARDFEAYQELFYPEGYWVGESVPDEIEVEGIGRVPTNDFLYVVGAFLGNGFTAYQKRVKINSTTGKENSSQSFRVFFDDVLVNKRARHQLELSLTNLGIKWTAQKGRAGEHVYFTSKPWMEYFDKQLGKGFKHKSIPKNLLKLSPDRLDWLFTGLVNTDGDGDKKFCTSSPKLRDTFIELVLKIGYNPHINAERLASSINKEGRIIKATCPNYSIILSGISRKITSYTHPPTMVPYNGKVWCLKVEDNKNFLVERNGHFEFCGNTDEVVQHFPPMYPPGDDQGLYFHRVKEESIEETRYFPTSPYSSSKACQEMVVNAYRCMYNLPVTVIRPTNFYGPSYPEKLIGKGILDLLNGGNIKLYGQGLEWRDHMSVFDTVAALDLIISQETPQDLYHVAGNREIQNKDTAKLILKVMGLPESRLEFIPDPRPFHDPFYGLDCTNLKKLGWAPKISLEEGIKMTVEYFKDHYNGQ